MNECLWVLTLLLNALISLRLLLFKARRGQQRRLVIGLLAWLLIVFNTTFALHVFWGWTQPQGGQVAALALLAGLLVRSRGNVARLAG